jgi:BirA family transcriptional regulator, biotin operon repressor / biotin---[acetyl-CoA-carboxylase] ligase
MQHLHLAQCSSTQSYLKDNLAQLLENDDEILISTDSQTAGIGRRGNSWLNLPDSLAFSFSLIPSSEVTLTSLELGVLLCKFFETFSMAKTRLELKWPNDLINLKHEKVGGIIAHLISFPNKKPIIIAGIGLNLFSSLEIDIARSSKQFPPGTLLTNPPSEKNFKQSWPRQIYQFIQAQRLSNSEIQKEWSQYSCHLNQQVEIIDSNKKISGHFKGINKLGAALIKPTIDSTSVIEVFNGSLFIAEE